MVAGTQTEVRSGEGKGGGSPAPSEGGDSLGSPSQPSVGAGRGGALEGTELWPLRAVHISVGGGGELYIAVPAGRTA